MSQNYKAKLGYIPDLVSLMKSHSDVFPGLFNSHIHNETTGRFSLLLAQSEQPVVANTEPELHKLLALFDKLIMPQQHDCLPFISGWLLYLSYSCVKAWEPSLKSIKHDENQPLAIAIRCQSAVVVDHIDNQAWVVADSEFRMNDLLKVINTQKTTAKDCAAQQCQLEVIPDDIESYIKHVNRIKEYIQSGDVYQVNLARQWRINSDDYIDCFALYDALSQNNPAPFAGLLHIDNFAVISSSPERLIKVSDNVIETRPIAGTRPRSDDKVKDQALIKELINNPKEQAEHIMLIDLERNDLGRVSAIGSVRVDELMVVESYTKVHHIVSNISAELAEQTTYYDVIKATFPGGTITGCPKIRCMQIIDELESQPRGAYTGSFGYITDDGRMDLNILIRTFTLSHQQLTFQAGAGVVYDSIAENEAKESYYKAQALISSL